MSQSVDLNTIFLRGIAQSADSQSDKFEIVLRVAFPVLGAILVQTE